MADPLSIASGVAGLVSLGLTVCSGLQTYVNTVKGRGEDIESTCQLLTLLRSYIDLIGSSTSTLINRYARATQGVSLGLKLCASQLKALDSVVQDLGVVDSLPNAPSKWRKQKAAALYPFNRTKLIQAQEQLLKATGVLGTFVQSLILNVNIGMDENLEAFKNAVNESNLITHDFLAQIREQTAIMLSSHALLHESTGRVSTKLDVITSEIQAIRTMPPSNHDRLIEQGSNLSYSRTTTVQRLQNKHLTTPQCSCGRYRTKNSYYHQTYYSWVGVAVSKAELHSIHRPECAAYAEPTSIKSTKTTLTYSGLRRFLSQVLDVSLTRDCGAGTYSVSFGLQACISVQKMAASDIVWDKCKHIIGDETSDLIGTVNSLKEELDVVYRSHRSSPLEATEWEGNIAHYSMWALGSMVWRRVSSARQDEVLDAARILLPYLRTIGVKVNETDSKNCTPFSMTMKGFAPRFISCVYDVLEEFDPQFIPPPASPDGMSQVELQNQTQWIDLMSSRLDIAQDCGYGDLALAIFQKDEKRLQVVLDSGRFSQDLFETNMCQRNVLHLCNTWPAGLRHLLQVERIRKLLNDADYIGLTPMDYALISSGSTCKSSDRWVECQNCSCCDGLRIFLEMDCKVVVDENRAATLKLCSMKARRMLLQSLKNRRERLFEIATTHLALEDLPDPKTWGVKVPDVGVDLLWIKLKEKGVKLSDALDINAGLLGDFKGFFSFTHCPRVAEMAINYGFLDVDEPDSRAVTPILDLRRSPPFKLDDFLIYVDWLLQKGANIDHSINSAKISVAHNLAQDCVDWIRLEYSTLVNIAIPRPSEHARVFWAVCTSKARSCLPCPCKTDELSLPLHHLLVHLLENYKFWGDGVRQRKLSVIVQEAKTILILLTRAVSGLDETYMAKSIIRTLTVQALDIKHLKECGLFWSHIHKWPEEELQNPERQEEWNEILDEDRLSIEKLEELTVEFEEEFLRQNIPVSDFLQDFWLPRMKQVRREWIRPFTEDQKQRLAENGVVLEDSEGFTRDPYSIEDEEEVQEGEDDEGESETESSGSTE